MNVDLFVIIVCFLSFIIGIFIGIKIFKIYNRKLDKKILKNAGEVLSGKRENKIKIDGEEYDATKFLLRDKNNNQILIDLKGGGKVQHGRKQEDSTRTKEVSNQEVETIGEVSEGGGKKKRTSRIRSKFFSRTRRFG